MDGAIVVCGGFILMVLLVGVAIFWPFVVLEILARRRHKQECADEVVRWRALRQRAHTKKGGE